MTKTVKQAIMEYFGVTLVPESLLKELEAIMSAAAPPAIDTPSRIKIYADDEGQMWYDRGQNDTIKRYEANLKQALYGKETN